jgi:hypothetical protein
MLLNVRAACARWRSSDVSDASAWWRWWRCDVFALCAFASSRNLLAFAATSSRNLLASASPHNLFLVSDSPWPASASAAA